MADETEPRGVDDADGRSSLVVGRAEYGSHASEPRRNTRRADGTDHIVMMKRLFRDRSWLVYVGCSTVQNTRGRVLTKRSGLGVSVNHTGAETSKGQDTELA